MSRSTCRSIRWRRSVETLYAHVKRLYRRHRDADGVYIQGGGWQTVRVIELLEKDLRIPVVHATICEAWQIHKQLDVRETKPGYGRLLAELLRASPERPGEKLKCFVTPSGQPLSR